eukprot:1898829-Prorocentrum_lima.AAC.1
MAHHHANHTTNCRDGQHLALHLQQAHIPPPHSHSQTPELDRIPNSHTSATLERKGLRDDTPYPRHTHLTTHTAARTDRYNTHHAAPRATHT